MSDFESRIFFLLTSDMGDRTLEVYQDPESKKFVLLRTFPPKQALLEFCASPHWKTGSTRENDFKVDFCLQLKCMCLYTPEN